MKRNSRLLLVLALLALVSLALIGTAVLAAADYQILWWTTDGGGGTSYAGETSYLTGSVSRYFASQVSKGGEYGLSGGFWGAPATAAQNFIFLPFTNH